MNIIDEAGILAISTRLQRLSERIRRDGVEIYKTLNIDFEPKWFPVIYTLHKRKTLGVVEIADEIGYSHPSTITLLKELEKKKLISSKKDSNDERKRLIALTAKGRKLVNQMQPAWKIMTLAAADLTHTKNDLLSAINEVEDQFKRKSFLQRALENMK